MSAFLIPGKFQGRYICRKEGTRSLWNYGMYDNVHILYWIWFAPHFCFFMFTCYLIDTLDLFGMLLLQGWNYWPWLYFWGCKVDWSRRTWTQVWAVYGFFLMLEDIIHVNFSTDHIALFSIVFVVLIWTVIMKNPMCINVIKIQFCNCYWAWLACEVYIFWSLG